MSSTAATPGTVTGAFDKTALDRLLRGREEPSWLVDRRRSAFERFETTPMPTLRDEEWRRTDIRALRLDQFAPPAPHEPSEAAREALEPAYRGLDALYGTGIAQVDGVPSKAPDPAKLGGAVFVDLASAVKEHGELLRDLLMTGAYQPGADAFAALHAAFWTGGVLLYVPKGVKVETPLFHLIGLSAEGNTDLNHSIVVLEEGAEATLVQETASGDRGRAPGLHVGGVELILRKGSRLRFVTIQNWDDATWHFSRERAVVGEDAVLQWTVGGLGSRLAKVNQEVALVGRGARAQVNGVIFTSGRQNLTYLTRQDHIAPNTTSDLLYKSGLKGKSRMVWRGMIKVEPDAQQTDAYQKNDNLVLDPEARADSIPGLEIEANEVRCTHGATAGPVDPEMVFYARSRGVDAETATRLIVEGFFADVYDRISVEPVRDTLALAVAQKLENGRAPALAPAEAGGI
ncbi:Fe-S cluster assembly protein SufD [Tautonia sociabilis]|uniref:Fe-S cluster assembly protein SufD n=1 Tax=Tautonia sociabilis TaxID=2080755 RepID=A0A432MPA6_9BACT|nr:Fe-S cluster assembly protein SufD [Tautonia sociabilis]RUL89271.1 Fe-S cluster assembly protein SufD [Tautonia sociabilis]